MLSNGKESLYRLLLDLVRIPSVSASGGEAEIARLLHARLAEMPYFQDHSDDLRLLPVEGDPLGRPDLWALVRADPPTERTVILTGHMDVVGVDDYGSLKDLAFDAESLTAALAGHDLAPSVRADLDSGDYLFGRGTMDMKCGLALEMGLIAEAAADRRRFGVNVAFLAVSDEENSSAGMRGALPHLASFQAQGLDFIAAVDTEPSDLGGGQEPVRNLFTGTVGKIMPFFLCVGRAAHVGACFDGLNANAVASRINLELEGNVRYADGAGGEWFAPPVCLHQRDLLRAYSVTLAERALAYYNVLTATWTPAQVLDLMVEAARRALSSALDDHRSRARAFAERTGRSWTDPRWEPAVLTVADLAERLRARGIAPESVMEEASASLDRDLDERERSVALAEALLDRSGREGPLVVVGFLPCYYPHRSNEGKTARERHVLDACRDLQERAREDFDEAVAHVRYFSGICDLSYFGFDGAPSDLKCLEANTPGWGSLYRLPLDALSGLDIPVVNFGPSGKDAHKATERLELSFSLEKAPKLLAILLESLGREKKGKELP